MFDFTTFKPDCVILGAGEYPKNYIPLNVLQHARYLCCCDGAARSLIVKGIIPDAVVGDGDSLPFSFKERYKDILHIITEQDDNDLTKATRFCKAQGHRKIAYIGTTGLREDHTLGNISLMSYYLHELHLEPVMFTDHGIFIPCRGKVSLRSFRGQQVSIFNLNCQALTSAGLKYPLYAVKEWWQGTLNEALGDSLTLNGDGNYLVFMTYEPKVTESECNR